MVGGLIFRKQLLLLPAANVYTGENWTLRHKHDQDEAVIDRKILVSIPSRNR